MIKKLPGLYNSIFCEKNIKHFEHFTVYFAIFAFCLHLFLIFIGNTFTTGIDIIDNANSSYISAIFTPFSVILFFEVFLLILSIPKSMSKSLAIQYEIISLIVIWRVFKDGSNLDEVASFAFNSEVFTNIMLDITFGIILFALVTVFYRTIKNRNEEDEIENKKNLQKFQKIKKGISLGLSAILILFAFTYLIRWLSDLINGIPTDLFDLQQLFFQDLFTVMIFTDILLVLLSYLFMDRYEQIFRNAAFIISTIFIRFSLTVDRPFDLFLTVLALTIGILVSFIFNSFVKAKDYEKY